MAGDLIDALPEFEFVFASTPEAGDVWIRDPPGGVRVGNFVCFFFGKTEQKHNIFLYFGYS